MDTAAALRSFDRWATNLTCRGDEPFYLYHYTLADDASLVRSHSLWVEWDCAAS